MAGRTIVGTPDEETMDIVLAKNYSEMVGIVFNDTHIGWSLAGDIESQSWENTLNTQVTTWELIPIFFATSSNPPVGMTDRKINKIKKGSDTLFAPELNGKFLLQNESHYRGKHLIIFFFLPVLQSALEML